MRLLKGNIEGTEGKKHTLVPSQRWMRGRKKRGRSGRKGNGREEKERKESICMCFDEGEKGEKGRRRETMCLCVLVSFTFYSYLNSSLILV